MMVLFFVVIVVILLLLDNFMEDFIGYSFLRAIVCMFIGHKPMGGPPWCSRCLKDLP